MPPPYTLAAHGCSLPETTPVRRVIARREALAALAMLALARPARAHHGGAGDALAEMTLGDPKAPITIIEYSSLTCPHCASFHKNTFPRIKERYIDTGKARLIYRDFPFDRTALFASALARCAGADRFFRFIDALFGAQASWSRAADPVAALVRIGRLGGLERAEIDACLGDKTLLDGILAMRVDGAKNFEVSSTPTFIINGEKLVGALPFERFEEIFERLL